MNDELKTIFFNSSFITPHSSFPSFRRRPVVAVGYEAGAGGVVLLALAPRPEVALGLLGGLHLVELPVRDLAGRLDLYLALEVRAVKLRHARALQATEHALVRVAVAVELGHRDDGRLRPDAPEEAIRSRVLRAVVRDLQHVHLQIQLLVDEALFALRFGVA